MTTPQRLIGTHGHKIDAVDGLQDELDAHANGQMGPPGQDGEEGEQGPPGPPGPAGAPGATGASGPAGAQGPIGTAGEDGMPGEDSMIPGPRGLTGDQGPVGVTMLLEDGAPGDDSMIPGPRGETGAQGPVGPFMLGADGDPGEDSYIVGPRGLTGAAGPNGYQPLGVMHDELDSEPLLMPAPLNTAIAVTWSGPHIWQSAHRLLTVAPDTTQPILVSSDGNAAAAGSPTIILQGANNKERIRVESYGTSVAPQYDGIGAGGTPASPTRTLNNIRIWGANAGGYDNAGTPAIHSVAAALRASAAEDWTATTTGTYWSFLATQAGTTTLTEVMRAGGNGNLLGASVFGYMNISNAFVGVPSNSSLGDITGSRLYVGQDGFLANAGLQGSSILSALAGADAANPSFTVSAVGNNGAIEMSAAGGTRASKTATPNNSDLGDLLWSGYTGSAYAFGARIEVYTTQLWTGTNNGTVMRFLTTLNTGGGSGNRMIVGVGGANGVVVPGFFGVGSASAPSNTTAGDVTGLRGHFGTDAAFTSGVSFETNAIRVNVGGTVALATNLTAVLQLSATTSGAGNVVSLMQMRGTLGGTGADQRGFEAVPTFNPGANLTQAAAVVASSVLAPAAGITITTGFSGFSTIVFSGSTGAITTSVSYGIGVPISGGGTLFPTTHYGLRIDNQGLAGITTSIGIHVAAVTGSTNNYDASFGTVDLTVPVVAYGRIPILYNGLKKYLIVYT